MEEFYPQVFSSSWLILTLEEEALLASWLLLEVPYPPLVSVAVKPSEVQVPYQGVLEVHCMEADEEDLDIQMEVHHRNEVVQGDLEVQDNLQADLECLLGTEVSLTFYVMN